jgi:polyhydroxyalkanoate synthase subunit PhaC
MQGMNYDFSEASLAHDLQKAIATNNSMMLHYWMIYVSATTKPDAFKPNYYLNEPSYGWSNQSNLESNRYLKSDSFLESFNEYMKSVINLHSMTKSVSYPAAATNSLLDKYGAEVIRGFLEMQETPHEVVYRMDDVRLLHYYQLGNNGASMKYSTPVVIVYAPVNSYHIMDIRRGRSIVEHFVSAGFNVYLVDWGRQLNNKPSLSDYVNYIHQSIEHVKKITHSKQVSILGYSWGGVLSMIYSSIRQENVKNLILQSAHVDFDKDSSILASWFRRLPLDDIVREFDSIDCRFINLALILRNPVVHAFDAFRFGGHMNKGTTYYHYYPQFGMDSMRIAAWMTDTPMIPAGFFRDYIGKLYQQNQLVNNELEVILSDKTEPERVNLAKITMPLLNIVGDIDDICTPPAATPINDIATSKDKKLLRFPTGHIELSVSSDVHEKLWPQVVKWLRQRSSSKE